MDFEAVRAKVQGPAIGLIVFAVLSILGQIGGLLYTIIAGIDLDSMRMMVESGDPDAILGVVRVLASTGGGCLGMVLSAIILVTGLKMRDMRSYGLCMAGSVLAMLPCGFLGCCCCFIGIGIGVWSIITLMKDDVKEAFQAQASGGM